jgi:hypothetical protein
MGASVSSNTAQAMADITNNIDNTTTTSSTNINEQQNDITSNKCSIYLKGDFNIKQSAYNFATNKQIAQGMSNSDLQNDIQQKMMQQAMSTVGSMGIGYANANNSASMFASATNTVVNEVKTVATNVSDAKNHITCSDSVIRANNINIGQGLSSNFVNNQVAKSNNVTKIANTISQTADQKATAKVAGLAGFILALAVLIIAFGWSFAKAASAGGVLKVFAMAIVLVLFGAIGVSMYLWKAPPFFNDPNICNLSFSYGDQCTDCINVKKQTIKVEETPMKYIFSLVGSPPTASGLTGSLLEMVVSSLSAEKLQKVNQGFNVSNANIINSYATQTYNNLPTEIKTKLQGSQGSPLPMDGKTILILKINQSGVTGKKYLQIPKEYGNDGTDNGGSCTPSSIQIDPNAGEKSDFYNCPTRASANSFNPTDDELTGIASLNIKEWTNYLENHPSPQYARFYLLRLLESDKIKFDLTTYEEPNGDEPIVYMKDGIEIVDIAKNVKDKAYKYTNSKEQNPSHLSKSGPGIIEGNFGVCNTREFQLQQFSRKIGIWILLVIVIGLFIYMFMAGRGKKGKK